MSPDPSALMEIGWMKPICYRILQKNMNRNKDDWDLSTL